MTCEGNDIRSQQMAYVPSNIEDEEPPTPSH